MITLGVDYGRRKIGLAIAEAGLAQPYKVLRITKLAKAVEKVAKEAVSIGVSKIIVGVSESEMGRESSNFALELAQATGLVIETSDETLTSTEAQNMAIAAGLSRKKRRQMEDAYAASLMLQNYLDFSHNKTNP